jgi:putative ABC transport system substrate-binding protein
MPDCLDVPRNAARAAKHGPDAITGLARLVHAAALALACVAAPAQPPRASTVAIVLPRPEGAIERAFRDYLAKSGVALRTVSLVRTGRAEDDVALRATLRALHPDLIYTWGAATTRAVAGAARPAAPDDAIRDIPVVFTSVADPVAAGLVVELERPGRNLTGAMHVAPLAAQFAAMRAWRPLHRLGVLYDPLEGDAVTFRNQLRQRAQAEHVMLLEEPLQPDSSGEPDPASIPAAVRRLRERGAEMLYIGPDPLLGYTYADLVTDAALEAGLPTFAATDDTLRRSKALLGLVSPAEGVGRLAAAEALQILRQHTPPGDMPVRAPSSFSVLLDMDVARRLGAYPPLRLLDVAQVIDQAP